MSTSAVYPISTRTEQEIAADTIARLLQGGVLRGDPDGIERAAKAVGISPQSIREAWALQRGKRPPPAYRPPPSRNRPQAGAAHPTPPERVKKKNPTLGVRICKGCERPKPVDDFDFKDKDHRWRRWLCKPCFKEYQAKRYLSSAQLKKLGNVLRFVLQDGDAHAGSACADCGEACKVGDEVLATDVTLRHAEHHLLPMMADSELKAENNA